VAGLYGTDGNAKLQSRRAEERRERREPRSVSSEMQPVWGGAGGEVPGGESSTLPRRQTSVRVETSQKPEIRHDDNVLGFHGGPTLGTSGHGSNIDDVSLAI